MEMGKDGKMNAVVVVVVLLGPEVLLELES
jgi:hypothetical protein